MYGGSPLLATVLSKKLARKLGTFPVNKITSTNQFDYETKTDAEVFVKKLPSQSNRIVSNESINCRRSCLVSSLVRDMIARWHSDVSKHEADELDPLIQASRKLDRCDDLTKSLHCKPLESSHCVHVHSTEVCKACMICVRVTSSLFQLRSTVL